MRRSLLLVAVVPFACAGRGPHGARPRVDVQWTEASGPRLEAAAFAVPGERLLYEGRWMGAAIGRVTVEVGGAYTVRGHRMLAGRTVAESSGLAAVFSGLWWQLDTTVDLDTGLPTTWNDRWSVTFGGERDHGTWEHTCSPDSSRHDLHSAVAMIRGWEPQPGQHGWMSVDIGGGFSVELAAAGGEWLPEFDRPALRYEGRALIGERHPFTVWISDDAERVPLRVDLHTRWGLVSLVLRRYQGEAAPVQRFDDGPSPL